MGWTKYSKKYRLTKETHILVVDGDSLAAGVFVRADMLVDTPVTPPATANTPLASSRAHSKKKKKKIMMKISDNKNAILPKQHIAHVQES